MPKLFIDGQEIEVEDGMTILQACKLLGKEVPHFCFHERLNIAGNCRMCLVEMEKSPKLVASCAMPVSEGAVIHTNTQKVKKAREGVMEFLLINHPLDCPICDRGGECDLQDQAFKYGNSTSRYSDNKRSVTDKNMGPLVKTSMNRCIHCTRCIRFATEVAGVEEIGALYRGEHMEITSYLEKTLTSELSGNIIDLCPVGALTSKPYAFQARSWELTKTESIDVFDAVGSNIRVDSSGLEVMRILPKMNDDVNEEWISDKARFAYDGLKNMRLDVPYVKKQGKLVQSSWEEALSCAAKMFTISERDEIAVIAGTLTATEPMFLMKKLLKQLNCYNMDANQLGYKIDDCARSNYLFNTCFAGIEKADLCLLIGANVRHSAPVVNARIGKMQRKGLVVASIGDIIDQTYKVWALGNDPLILNSIKDGQHEFAKDLTAAKYPMIIVGDGIYSRGDGYGILGVIHDIVAKYQIMREDWRGFNILHNHASIVGSLDIGFTPGNKGSGTKEILRKTKTGEIKLVYLLGADEIDMNELGNDTFVIYQGHHGDAGANRADIILPSAAYTEQDAIYVNMEGRPQLARAAVTPPAQAKEDWVIIKELAKRLKIDLEANDLYEVRRQMSDMHEVFAHIDECLMSDFVKFACADKILKRPITQIDINYYMTDPISRASVTMAKCTQDIGRHKEQVA